MLDNNEETFQKNGDGGNASPWTGSELHGMTNHKLKQGEEIVWLISKPE
jgi:hypothetical protein